MVTSPWGTPVMSAVVIVQVQSCTWIFFFFFNLDTRGKKKVKHQRGSVDTHNNLCFSVWSLFLRSVTSRSACVSKCEGFRHKYSFQVVLKTCLSSGWKEMVGIFVLGHNLPKWYWEGKSNPITGSVGLQLLRGMIWETQMVIWRIILPAISINQKKLSQGEGGWYYIF